MSLVKQPLTRLEIVFETIDIPPPFSHRYSIAIRLETARPQLDFEIAYSGREHLSEEEILEEGFHIDDDFHWKGELPSVWKNAFLEELRRSKSLFDQPKQHAQQALSLSIAYQGGDVKEGLPNNQESWVYFSQEIIQAIYEVSEKERPLEIVYLEIGKQGKREIKIRPSFSYRKVQVNTYEQGQTSEKEHTWKVLKPLLSTIYLPDYNAGLALPQAPKKQGSYISPGDGLWYELGKAVVNPGEKRDVVGEMQQRIWDM